MLETRIVPITFDIPQVHEDGFYRQELEKGLRSERGLMLAPSDFNSFWGMYFQGMSTRKVA